MKKNILIISILFALISWGVYDFVNTTDEIVTVNAENLKEGLEKGNIAPDFELNTLDGSSFKLSDFRGKKIILNFWASWCPPCQAEMPHMQDFYEDKKNEDIVIIAVNLTKMERNEQSIRAFANNLGITFPIPLDVDGEIGNKYHAFTIPTSYVIDTNGLIQNKIIGPMSYEMMDNYTKKIN